MVLMVFSIFSCGLFRKIPKEDFKTFGFNGIYLVTENGIEYPFFYDSSKSLIIDTVPIIKLSDIEIVKKQKDKNYGFFNLYLKLTEDAKNKFALVSQKHIGEPFAIILNNKLISAPIVQTEILGGEITITGIDDKIIDTFVKTFKSYKKQ